MRDSNCHNNSEIICVSFQEFYLFIFYMLLVVSNLNRFKLICIESCFIYTNETFKIWEWEDRWLNSKNVKRKFSCQTQINTGIENNQKFHLHRYDEFYLNLHEACVLVCSNWMSSQEI